MKTKFKNSSELCQYVSEYSNGKCMLAFSCGKDSIVAWLYLRKYFKEIIPYHLELIPGLSFVQESLKYYEDYFQTKIYTAIHPSFWRMFNNLVFQAPENINIVERFGFGNYTERETVNVIRKQLKIPDDVFVANGVKAADSIMRYISMKKHGQINYNDKKFYPIFDFKKADMIFYLRKHKIKLPKEYQYFGRSFDGIDYRFIAPIKKYFPADYQKIKELFPLVDIEILRYEWRNYEPRW